MGRIITIITVMITLLAPVSVAQPSEKEWQRLTNEALDHYYYGRNKEAVSVAREALKEAEALFGPDDLKVVGAADDLATYLVSTGNIEEAEALYQRALAILQKKLPPDDRYLAIFMDYLALFYDKIGKNDYAAQLRQQAKAIRGKGKDQAGQAQQQ